MHHEELKVEAVAAGMAAEDVADFLDKWGDTVLRLAIDALRNGLSKDFVVEVLKVLGPLFLELINNTIKTDRLVMGSPEKAVTESHYMGNSMLPNFVEKLLTNLINMYGQEIVKKIVDKLSTCKE